MKFLKQTTHSSFPVIVISSLLYLSITNLHSQALKQPISEQTFASPDDAVKALKADVQHYDRDALLRLFGPEFNELITGDEVQDANNVKHFASEMSQGTRIVHDDDNKIELEVGPDDWPMPIPLVRVDGQWHFDTASGKEELINRHVGEDELNAIGVCRAYVDAQKSYAQINPNNSPYRTYARHLKSDSGQKDGLYWAASGNGPRSPFGELVAEAQDEGYTIHLRHTGRHPFHGYYFRVLTQQGEAAPGGVKDYLINGNLTGGFALVAYPEHWSQSGIMTFIVNQDGTVYQCDLGEKTDDIALSLKQYNPSPEWILVPEEGINMAR